MGLPNITIALQADNNLYLSRVDQAGFSILKLLNLPLIYTQDIN